MIPRQALLVLVLAGCAAVLGACGGGGSSGNNPVIAISSPANNVSTIALNVTSAHGTKGNVGTASGGSR